MGEICFKLLDLHIPKILMCKKEKKRKKKTTTTTTTKKTIRPERWGSKVYTFD